MTTNPGTTHGEASGPSSDAAAPTVVQRLAAEALGTFALVFLGAGGVAFAAGAIGSGGVGTNALAFGFALVFAGYALSRVSGGHFNPAVSIGAALAGRLSWRDAGTYAAAQVIGAVAAGLALLVLILGYRTADAGDSLFQTGFGDEFSGFAWWAAILLEVVLTAAFVLLVLSVTDDRNEHRGFAPLAVGLGYAAVVFAGAAATGGSANPARTIGTNLFGGLDAILSLLVIVVATLIGGALAGFLHPLLFGRHGEAVAGSGLNFQRRPKQPKQDQQYAGWGGPGAQQGYYDQGQQDQGQWGQQQGGWQGQQQGWQGQQAQQGYDQGYGQQQGYEQPQQGWDPQAQQQAGWQGQQGQGYDQGQQQAGWQGQQGQGYDQGQQQPYDQGQQGWGEQQAPQQGGWDRPQEPGHDQPVDPGQPGQPDQQGWDGGDDGGHTRMR